MIRAAAIPALLALAGCGSTGELAPRKGQPLPPAPYGATATPTPDQLMTPTVQARPARTDELLYRSRARTSDDFDLPPD